LNLFAQVARVDFDMAGFVNHLSRGVEFRVHVRHRLHNLRRADERPLFAVQELRKAPGFEVMADFGTTL
jgi:hypothetical protein